MHTVYQCILYIYIWITLFLNTHAFTHFASIFLISHISCYPVLTAKKCRVWLPIPKRMWIEVGHPKTWRLWPAKTKHIDPYLPGKPISHRHFQEEQMFEFHLNFQMFILFSKTTSTPKIAVDHPPRSPHPWPKAPRYASRHPQLRLRDWREHLQETWLFWPNRIS